MGVHWVPSPGWPERGGSLAGGHGNSVPRFHITWGTGPAIVEIFARRLVEHPNVRFAHRHQVDELIVDGAAVTAEADPAGRFFALEQLERLHGGATLLAPRAEAAKAA